MAWRVVLIVAVILTMVFLADLLRQPGGLDSTPDDAAGAPDLTWPPEVVPSGNPPAPDPVPTTRREVTDELRQAMAGLMMAALGEGEGDPAREPDPNEAQRRVADLFALPYDYPQSEAPPGLLPDGAKVLVAFENPMQRGCRMLLARMPGSVDVVLEAFHRHYDSLGWQHEPLKSPQDDRGAQPDRGWLVEFHQVREGRVVRRRLVYARPRAAGDETLVAVYDPQHRGE